VNKPHGALAQTLGARLALWYAAIFVGSTLLLCVIAYALLARSLEARDREIVQVKLADYAARYASGGVRGLSQAVLAEQAAGSPDRVFVRLVGANAEVLVTSMPSTWGVEEIDRLGRHDEGWRRVPAREAPIVLERRSSVSGRCAKCAACSASCWSRSSHSAWPAALP
jgi:hypothetical protein